MTGFFIGCAVVSLLFYIAGVMGDAAQRRTLPKRVVRHIGSDDWS